MFPQPGREVLLRKLWGNGPPEMSPPNRVIEDGEILLQAQALRQREGPAGLLRGR